MRESNVGEALGVHLFRLFSLFAEEWEVSECDNCESQIDWKFPYLATQSLSILMASEILSMLSHALEIVLCE